MRLYLAALTSSFPFAVPGQDSALAYARLHFPPFYSSCGVQLRRLMGALTYVKQPHSTAPYADLFKKDLWSDLELEFVRQSCALLGQVGAAR